MKVLLTGGTGVLGRKVVLTCGGPTFVLSRKPSERTGFVHGDLNTGGWLPVRVTPPVSGRSKVRPGHEAERIELSEIVLTDGTAADVCAMSIERSCCRSGRGCGCRHMCARCGPLGLELSRREPGSAA